MTEKRRASVGWEGGRVWDESKAALSILSNGLTLRYRLVLKETSYIPEMVVDLNLVPSVRVVLEAALQHHPPPPTPSPPTTRPSSTQTSPEVARLLEQCWKTLADCVTARTIDLSIVVESTFADVGELVENGNEDEQGGESGGSEGARADVGESCCAASVTPTGHDEGADRVVARGIAGPASDWTVTASRASAHAAPDLPPPSDCAKNVAGRRERTQITSHGQRLRSCVPVPLVRCAPRIGAWVGGENDELERLRQRSSDTGSEKQEKADWDDGFELRRVGGVEGNEAGLLSILDEFGKRYGLNVLERDPDADDEEGDVCEIDTEQVESGVEAEIDDLIWVVAEATMRQLPRL
ncbi:hypothetical protein BLNAU_5008 [Blattamonas nauphoetae]|uniref:Uncharacterized protein n=1 Tax=Blattamonas nauphoetae TaxID=2049346 RepID=A0ABQ9Y8T7_9EUKA|nr:hypothetical protein BLNAU_5008 [Blattamonas nauphoetae]